MKWNSETVDELSGVFNGEVQTEATIESLAE